MCEEDTHSQMGLVCTSGSKLHQNLGFHLTPHAKYFSFSSRPDGFFSPDTPVRIRSTSDPDPGSAGSDGQRTEILELSVSIFPGREESHTLRAVRRSIKFIEKVTSKS